MTVEPETRPLRATARRAGRWWKIEIPELDTSGQSPTVRDIPEIAAEIASECLAVSPASVVVDTEIELPGEAEALWAAAAEQEEAGRAALTEAARLRRETIRALSEQGLRQADIARLLNLTPQRINQLMTTEGNGCPSEAGAVPTGKECGEA
ncbi:hypothetical protein D9V32_10625 [Mycetocola tolaasinivorans]|uniref:Uncharacterized protein n=1 Tax=Mycetocola tolaasinivorans TaxID=76635 RepID=A0A3L7A6Y8_9MICO|nr:hypothetical protein [Mycetocola tolaasinivorans]RLP75331.1 hypothetical protein D9V32_10625 [Mycetocola tolaasinivorans]